MSNLTFKYLKMGTLFGVQYYIEVTKRCKGTPGFAPEHYDDSCGRLVIKYKDYKPYWQNHNAPANLEISEVKEILDKLEEPFDENKFAFEVNDDGR